MITEPATLQFGVMEPGLDYRDRPCAFGVAERDGLLALVRVRRDTETTHLDLPGGAIDEGESESDALVREFGEETGLRVRAQALLTRASQYLRKYNGEPLNNHSGLYLCTVEGEAPELKIEEDHELVWVDPAEAVSRLRHDSHAWAVACWLRSA